MYYLNVWLVYIKTSTDAVKNLQTYVKSSLDLYVANVISLTHTHTPVEKTHKQLHKQSLAHI